MDEKVVDQEAPNERRPSLQELLSKLTPQERRLIELTFGLTGGQPKMPSGVAAELGISEKQCQKLSRFEQFARCVSTSESEIA